MAKATYSAYQSIYITSGPASRMNVSLLRAFLVAIDAAGIDGRETIEAHRSNVGHLTHLSVRTTKEVAHPDDPESTP